MENFVKLMVTEHAQLVTRVQALHDYVYSEKSDNDDKIEFANKAIQLAAMKKYEEALRARLENQNIVFDENRYFEKVGEINSVEIDVPTENEPQPPYEFGECKK